MQYIVFGFGLLALLFTLYRFFVTASVAQIRKFLSYTAFGIYALLLLYLAISGRFIIAVGFVLLAVPFVISYFRKQVKDSKNAKAALRDLRDQKDDEDAS